MKTKSKLWLGICTMALCLGIISFGVYSALSVNLNINGSLGFNMHNAMVTVSGTIYNLAEIPQGQNYANKIDRPIECTIMGGEGATTGSLSLGDMYFFQYDTNAVYDIVFELSFTNISSTAILATIPAPTLRTGVTLLHNDTTNGYTDFSSNYTPVIIQDASVTVKFALRLNNINTISKQVGFFWENLIFEQTDISPHTDTQGVIYTLNSQGEWSVSGHANTYMAEIEIPSIIYDMPVTAIADKAFYMCLALTNITMPDSIKIIGSEAFCSAGLTSLTIPEGVVTIGDKAFNFCSKIFGSLVIPDSVETIGLEAFFGCGYFTSLTIGNNVKSIGQNAFRQFTRLTSITIPDSVQSIGDYAFYDCTRLTSITIPEGVTSIGECAFGNCYDLINVVFKQADPSKISFGATIFNGSTALTDIYVPNSTAVTNYKAVTNLEPYKTLIVEYPSTYTDTQGICYTLSNGEWSVTGPASTYSLEINIPSTLLGRPVTSIGDNAFDGKSRIISVNLPNSITTIGKSAFANCKGLTNVNIPYGVKDIKQGCFYYCRSLASIIIPDSVISIGSQAFQYCYSLTSITIPKSVTSIDNRGFQYCMKLVTVINKSGLNITASGNSDYGYVGCYAKQVITDDADSLLKTDSNGFIIYNDTLLMGYTGTNTDITIPIGISEINDYAFYYGTNLTSVVISDNVTKIGYMAFYECESLTIVTIGRNVAAISEYAFFYCSKLASVINRSALVFTKGSSANGHVAYYAKTITVE